jgi:hypothetical protein
MHFDVIGGEDVGTLGVASGDFGTILAPWLSLGAWFALGFGNFARTSYQ